MLTLPDGRVAVGAPKAHIGGGLLESGAVNTYDWLTGNLLQTIEGTSDNRLGASFAVFNNMASIDLVIGAPGGLGHIEKHGGTPLVLNAFVPDPFPEMSSPDFGAAVASTGNTIFVGAPLSNGDDIDSGRVTAINGLTGTMVDVIDDGVDAGGHAGASLALMGNELVFGAPGEGPMVSGRVVAYLVFPVTSYLYQIDDPIQEPGAEFGFSVCDFDGVLVVGAPGQDATFTESTVNDVGSVFIVKPGPPSEQGR